MLILMLMFMFMVVIMMVMMIIVVNFVISFMITVLVTMIVIIKQVLLVHHGAVDACCFGSEVEDLGAPAPTSQPPVGNCLPAKV